MRTKRISLIILLAVLSVTPVLAQPGALDPSFGVGGIVTLRFGDLEDQFRAVAVQEDGKIVAAGKNGSNKIIVARYDASGNLDNSFNGDGIFVSELSNVHVAQAIALQEDGKIIVAGIFRVSASNEDFLVIRLDQNGELDSTFNGNGIVQTSLTGGIDYARDLAIQSDGKIVIAGSAGTAGDAISDIGIVRLNSNGTLDESFDGDGKVITAIAKNAEQAYAVKIQDDGKIVVLANPLDFKTPNGFLAILRYMPDGSLDPDFGDQGISLTDLGSDRFYFGDIELQADGKIVATASIDSNSSFTYSFTVLRFLPGGEPDLSFDSDGRQVILQDSANFAESLLVQPDGKIIASGHAMTASEGLNILLTRLNPNGSFDPGFGSGGVAFTPVADGNGGDYSYDSVLQPDGKIVVAGDFRVFGLQDYDAVLLRFLGDPVTDPTGTTVFDFDGDGITDVSVFRPSPGSLAENAGPEGSSAQWWVLRSSDQGTKGLQFGNADDIPTAADFTGDGKTDVAFWRPSTGEWFILRSEDDSFFAFPFGSDGDIPAPGDFDGDGLADAAVFRPSSGTWFILRSSDSGVSVVPFGIAEDKPTVADFDGDGMDDIAVFRPSVSQWWQLRSTAGVKAYQFGSQGDRTTVGDWTGDGKADVAFFRPSSAEWYVIRSEDDSYFAFPWGAAGDIPSPGDYDGDGVTDPAIWRPSDRTWYIFGSTNGFEAVLFGATGDVPLPSSVSVQ
ncbi:MAG TPA: FG-GAP-like repeat-containing protein [Aridibacter sp.]|nr:FG-GAP-like repeat-containing protein [Aridibacter sp.]